MENLLKHLEYKVFKNYEKRNDIVTDYVWNLIYRNLKQMEQETIEEAAKRLYPIHIKSIIDKYDDGITNVIGEEDVNEDCRESFISGAKWQAQRMYSEEEVYELMIKAFNAGFNKYESVEAGLEGKETDLECANILTKYIKSKLK